MDALSIYRLVVLVLTPFLCVPVYAQASNSELFSVQRAGGNDINCAFRVDPGASFLNRQRFLARPPRQELSVAVMNGLVDNAGSIDLSFTAASALIQQDSGGADVDCCAAIARQGPITIFAQPAGMIGGTIQTQADLDAVIAINADIKIVTAINFCGVPGTFGGCQSGNSLVLTTGFAAATVAHEAGHMLGLCHVAQNCNPTCGQAGTCANCTDPLANRIMYFALCAGQNLITTAECNAFQGGAVP